MWDRVCSYHKPTPSDVHFYLFLLFILSFFVQIIFTYLYVSLQFYATCVRVSISLSFCIRSWLTPLAEHTFAIVEWRPRTILFWCPEKGKGGQNSQKKRSHLHFACSYILYIYLFIYLFFYASTKNERLQFVNRRKKWNESYFLSLFIILRIVGLLIENIKTET